MFDINNPNPRDVEQAFYKLCHTVNTHQRAFRTAERTFKNLDSLKELFYNKLIHEAEGDKHNQKERNAKLSNEWKNFSEGLHAAEMKMLDAKAEFKIRERNWETCRSILSSLNTERRTNT